MKRSLIAAGSIAAAVLLCALWGAPSDTQPTAIADSGVAVDEDATKVVADTGTSEQLDSNSKRDATPAGPVAEPSLPAAPPPRWIDEEVTVGRGDFISTILQSQGLTYSESLALVEASKEVHNLEKIRRGDVFTFRRTGAEGRFVGLSYPLDRHHEQRLVVVRNDRGKFIASRDAKTFETQIVGKAARIEGSLWNTVTSMNLGWGTAANLAAIFEWELDFNTQVREGDTFRVLVEELRDANTGDVVRYGKIHAAEYVNSGKAFVGIRYEDDDGDVGFFNAEGMSSKKMFLKSPLKFSRVSSNFGRRFHPILKKWKNHNGTDYAAPRGTPIRAIGRGKVVDAGTRGGYGKQVKIKHNGKYISSYSHLHKIKVKRGTTVRQGDIIGTVGSTGLATGPHLHFEFFKDGKRRDFRKQTFARTEPIAKRERPAFEKLRDQMLPKLRGLALPEPGARQLVLGDSPIEDADSSAN